jgi:UDP-2,4-diacetamido-2,4,6-trideoxy-beta-L-altropyranose hydrolase
MILFRCDSSHRIGTGHVIRCIHLAKMLRESGKEVHFLCRTDEGNINERIVNEGFQLHPLDSAAPNQSDLALISELKPQWLIIDSYEIQKSWEEKVPSGIKIFVIDDLMNREHHCQVLLDQNFRKNSRKYQQLVSADTKLLLGPQYCLLSSDLERSTALSLSKPPYKVLVFFGGTDSTGESLKFLEALKKSQTKLKFTLVVLSSHKNLEAVQNSSLPSQVTLKVDPSDWFDLLRQHDLYLGSGGTVTWERMYLGLPGAVISVASNQDEPSRDLSEAGYQVYFGPASQINYREVLISVEKLFDKPTELTEMSRRGLSLVSRFSKELVKEIFD